MSFLARHADSPEVIDDVDAWQARDVNPEGRLAARQDVEHLRQAVSELPLAYRQVVMLALEDLSYAEIGEVLGITESNVGARLTRARALLKASLKGLL